MQCPQCQQDNPPDSNFSLGCGSRLGLACASCGAKLPSGSRFCNKCGSPAGPGASSRFGSPGSYTPKHLAERILTSRGGADASDLGIEDRRPVDRVGPND
jgi:hypothetical protein